jgi:hypothetical protein
VWVKPFEPVSGPTVFSTEEEAVILGVAYGQRSSRSQSPSNHSPQNDLGSIAIAEEVAEPGIIRVRTHDTHFALALQVYI